MGRGVSHLSHAIEIAYFDLSLQTDDDGKVNGYDENDNEIQREPDDVDYEMNWDDFFGNIKYSLLAKYNSLVSVDEWDGNETKIFLKNDLVEIGVSEYCGCASVSIRVNEYYIDDYNVENLANNWISRCWDNICKTMKESTYHRMLIKQGTFSNGVSVYNYAQ